MKSKVYLGLDTAIISGIAVWYPLTFKAYVVQVKGTPPETFGYLCQKVMPLIVKEQPTVVMEKLTHFRNADTTRSLLERYGFIKYSLMCNYQGLRIEEPTTSLARGNLKVKDKEDVFKLLSQYYQGAYFTDNHADALSVAIYQSVNDGIPFRLDKLCINSGLT